MDGLCLMRFLSWAVTVNGPFVVGSLLPSWLLFFILAFNLIWASVDLEVSVALVCVCMHLKI